ncbi:MAG TPA: VOC family protein, partial [Rubrivivax sp.]|nr:VOC family protein [Rubrivivax sp.]
GAGCRHRLGEVHHLDRRPTEVEVGQLPGLKLAYLDLGGTTIELMHFTETVPAPRPEGGERMGYRMMALEVDDMQAALSMLAQKGIECSWGPLTRPAYARAEIRDPDGNSIELRQWIQR